MDNFLKNPLIKNIINGLKSLTTQSKSNSPQQLYSSSMNNDTRRNLTRALLKEKGTVVEDDLRSLFEFLTSPSLRYTSTYASKKAQGKILTNAVSNFYNNYGKENGFETELDLFIGLSLHIGDRVKSKVSKVAESATEDTESFSPEESAYLESCRSKLLSQFADPANINDQTYGFMFSVAHQELSTCSLSKVKSFISTLKQNIDDKTQHYTNAIKELEVKKIAIKNPGLDISIEYLRGILSYYQNVSLEDSTFMFMRNQNLLKEPDSLLTILVDKKIDTSKFDQDLSLLQNINNLIVCMQTGLLSNDIFFNGTQFICQNPNYPKFPFSSTNATRVVRQLPELNRENQSILAYNEDYVQSLLKEKKYPITKISLPSEEGQVKELTLYTTQLIQQESDLKECSFPLFVKSLTSNEDKNTAEIALYAISGPGISLASQICRIDKVKPYFHGKASVHRQTSGEMLETNTHIHGYNLFDKVVNITSKNAGHFDIAVNFNLEQQVTNEQLEAFFDNWCGLPHNEAALDVFMEDNASFNETTRMINKIKTPEEDLSVLLPEE
ncbi:MAG: hypothetical protein IJB10_01185 [Clostridia bacterium]|nr:hypothetical protein [Clostridia bacterium]